MKYYFTKTKDNFNSAHNLFCLKHQLLQKVDSNLQTHSEIRKYIFLFQFLEKHNYWIKYGFTRNKDNFTSINNLSCLKLQLL